MRGGCACRRCAELRGPDGVVDLHVAGELVGSVALAHDLHSFCVISQALSHLTTSWRASAAMSWKMVPARNEVCVRQVEHWNICRTPRSSCACGRRGRAPENRDKGELVEVCFMRSVSVEFCDTTIEISLQLFDRAVNLFAQRNAIVA